MPAGSKIDAVLLRRDGNVLGAARAARPRSRRDRHGRASWNGSPTPWSRRAATPGVDPDHQPVAELGMYCVAGADLPGGRSPDRAVVPPSRPHRERRGAQRHVRGPPGGNRADVGRRGRVRLRHQLLGRRAERPHVPIPGVRGAVGGLGRGSRHRQRRPLVLGEGGGRARGARRSSERSSPSTSGSRARGS